MNPCITQWTPCLLFPELNRLQLGSGSCAGNFMHQVQGSTKARKTNNRFRPGGGEGLQYPVNITFHLLSVPN